MRLLSINVGQPTLVQTPHGDVLTSIFKQPVLGSRKVILHNVEGDRQADLTVHGGRQKAVYAYASEHYEAWASELPGMNLAPGMFGENLTINGLFEEQIHINDLVTIGTVKLRVTQPRMPCYKLGIRFDRSDMVKRFWKSGRSGIYFSVEEPGDLEAGNELFLEPDPLRVSIADVLRLYKGETNDAALYSRFMALPATGSWKRGIQERWVEA